MLDQNMLGMTKMASSTPNWAMIKTITFNWTNHFFQVMMNENVLRRRIGLSHHSSGIVEMCYWNHKRFFCSSGLNINQIFCFQIVRSQNRTNCTRNPSSSVRHTEIHAYVRDIYCWISCIDLVSSCLCSLSLPVGAVRKGLRSIVARVYRSPRCRRVGGPRMSKCGWF